jgi:hypothetical protein
MTRYFKGRHGLIAIALVAAAALVAGKMALSAVRSDRDKQEVATMTEKMKTICVGRFLIDLPEQAKHSFQGAFLEGFDIRVFPETDTAFRARVADREIELRNPKPDYDGEVKQLEAATDLKVSDFIGRMFVYGRKTTYWFEGPSNRVESTSVQIEGYANANGFSVNFSKKFADPERLDVLRNLLAQLRLNPEDKIPDEPGFCIDHAYFREPLTADQGERVTMLAGLPAHSDLTIMFDTIAGVRPAKDGLLARAKKGDEGDSAEVKARSKQLNAGTRAINGIPGEQILERFIERNAANTFAFMWESPATADNVFRPALSLEMQAGVNHRAGGKPVQSSVSEKALLDLWGKISSSIRVRPAEPPKVSAAEPPPAPIGTYAWAGDRCPESGWWQCSAGGAGVLGGQRQYLKQGERIPQALLLPPQTLWEKVKGLQRSYETKTPTSWKLIDKRSRERVVPAVPLAPATIVASNATTTAGANGPGAAEQSPPVGTFAPTGIPCPARGWWHCEESHALDGTRWFAQGSLLPAATFTVPAEVFGKSGNGPKVIQRRVTWRLVRYAQSVAAIDLSPSSGSASADSGA